MGYRLINRTRKKYECGIGACSAVYELGIDGLALPKEIVRKYLQKPDQKDFYLIIGRTADAEDFGLQGKISRLESLIIIPQGLLEDIIRSNRTPK